MFSLIFIFFSSCGPNSLPQATVQKNCVESNLTTIMKRQEPQQSQGNKEEKCSMSSCTEPGRADPNRVAPVEKHPKLVPWMKTNLRHNLLICSCQPSSAGKKIQEQLLICYQKVINWAECENSQLNQNQVHRQNLFRENGVQRPPCRICAFCSDSTCFLPSPHSEPALWLSS